MKVFWLKAWFLINIFALIPVCRTLLFLLSTSFSSGSLFLSRHQRFMFVRLLRRLPKESRIDFDWVLWIFQGWAWGDQAITHFIKSWHDSVFYFQLYNERKCFVNRILSGTSPKKSAKHCSTVRIQGAFVISFARTLNVAWENRNWHADVAKDIQWNAFVFKNSCLQNCTISAPKIIGNGLLTMWVMSEWEHLQKSPQELACTWWVEVGVGCGPTECDLWPVGAVIVFLAEDVSLTLLLKDKLNCWIPHKCTKETIYMHVICLFCLFLY